MVERLQPVEPVEKRSTDVDLLGEATKVVLTVGAAPAVGANAVEAAVLVFTEAGHMLQCRSGYLLIIDS